MTLAETYLQLVANWPHWAFELTVEAATGLLLSPLVRRAIKAHDRRTHGKDSTR